MQATSVDVPLVTIGYRVFAKYSNSSSQITGQFKNSLLQAESGKNSLILAFDVFDFSRGTVTARRFVNMVNSLDPSVTSILTEVAQEKVMK